MEPLRLEVLDFPFSDSAEEQCKCFNPIFGGSSGALFFIYCFGVSFDFERSAYDGGSLSVEIPMKPEGEIAPGVPEHGKTKKTICA